MPDWTDREEAPELGPGWVRMSKKRPDGQQGAKQVDHIWISPEGRRFRSLKNAHEHLSGYPVGQVAAPAKEKPKKKAKPKSAKVPYKRTQAGQAAAAAAPAAAAAATGHIVCHTCGSPDDEPGNDILLCDGPGCESAFHMQCLPTPLDLVVRAAAAAAAAARPARPPPVPCARGRV